MGARSSHINGGMITGDSYASGALCRKGIRETGTSFPNREREGEAPRKLAHRPPLPTSSSAKTHFLIKLSSQKRREPRLLGKTRTYRQTH